MFSKYFNRNNWLPLLCLVAGLLLSQSALARVSLSGLQNQVNQLDQRLTDCEQGIGGACPGTSGPAGEQGPQGEPGIQGEQGEQGEQGPPGRDADSEPPLAPIIGAVLFDTIRDGDSILYAEAFDIRQLVFGIERNATPQAGSAGGGDKANARDILLTINDQGQVPNIFRAALDGSNIPEVKIWLDGTGGGLGPAGTAVMELTLTNVRIGLVENRPASRAGEPSLIDLALVYGKIEVATVGFGAFFDAIKNTAGDCLRSSFDFVNQANASSIGKGSGLPISGFSLTVANVGSASSGGGGGSAIATFSPVEITAGFLPEAACLFGKVATGIAMAEVRIYDGFVGSGQSTLVMENVTASKFELSSTVNGQIEIKAAFSYARINWITEVPGAGGGDFIEIEKGWDLETNKQL